jgi:hypothetical protein
VSFAISLVWLKRSPDVLRPYCIEAQVWVKT